MPRPADWPHQPESLAGKKAILTGGTTGIGRAILRLLVAEGCSVFTFGREQAALDEALQHAQHAATGDAQAFGVTADASRLEDLRRVFDEADRRLGGLDILVNNAAIAAEDTASTDPQTIAYTVNTNLTAYLVAAHLAVERMKKAGRGDILAIGSMSADVRETGSDVYVATKAGIQGWAESFRKQVNSQGIRVVLIEPGSVSSDMQGNLAKQKVKQFQGKMLYAEDIAECAYYCLTQPRRCDVVEVDIRPHGQAI